MMLLYNEGIDFASKMTASFLLCEDKIRSEEEINFILAFALPSQLISPHTDLPPSLPKHVQIEGFCHL